MENSESNQPPENFISIIQDFTRDLTLTFPEYSYLWSKWSNPELTDADVTPVFAHCMQVFPERFFDILNQNTNIFEPASEVNTVFLPNVEFKLLYHCEGISEKTRLSIWKYLQVILFMLVGSVKNKMDFGDTLNMFEGINEDDLQEKIKDAISSIGDFFGSNEEDENADNENGEDTTGAREAFQKAFDFINKDDDNDNDTDTKPENPKPFRGARIPKPEVLQEHLQNLFNGKIGKLAKELADDLGEDLANSFGEDMQNVKSTKDVFTKLMQNPQKISGIVKTVGEKLNEKMTKGDISREDIMGEASEMMKRMKEMGGGEDFANMFKTMAKSMGVNIPKGAKFDTNAFTQMEQKLTTRDKMKARAQMKHQQKMAQQLAEQAKIQKQHEDHAKFMAANAAKGSLLSTDDPTNFVFSLEGEEKQQKSTAPPKSTSNAASTSDPVEEKQGLSASQKKKLKLKAKKLAKAAAETQEEPETILNTSLDTV